MDLNYKSFTHSQNTKANLILAVAVIISMSQEYQRILDEVSKIVNEAPRLYQALGKDSWN